LCPVLYLVPTQRLRGTPTASLIISRSGNPKGSSLLDCTSRTCAVKRLKSYAGGRREAAWQRSQRRVSCERSVSGCRGRRMLDLCCVRPRRAARTVGHRRALLVTVLSTAGPDGSPSARQDHDVDVEISWVAQLGWSLRPSPAFHAAQSKSKRKSFLALGVLRRRWFAGFCTEGFFHVQDTRCHSARGDRSPAIRLAASVLIDDPRH